MCLFYIACVGAVLFKNAENLLPSLKLVFSDAFSFRAAAGGAAGSAVRIGFARAVYSNEAGWGTSPMLHATAEVSHPVRQGILGAFEVFADTAVVCTATALLVICTGAFKSGVCGAELALSAIEGSLGPFARIVVALSVFLFGLSSAVGWYAYYVTLVNHAVKNVRLKKLILGCVMLLSPLFGVLLTFFTERSGGGSRLVWAIADFSAVIPTAVNLSVLLCMRKTFARLVSDYECKNEERKE
jgi:AGCS family alanine or glycine:cation symporter